MVTLIISTVIVSVIALIFIALGVFIKLKRDSVEDANFLYIPGIILGCVGIVMVIVTALYTTYDDPCPTDSAKVFSSSTQKFSLCIDAAHIDQALSTRHDALVATSK